MSERVFVSDVDPQGNGGWDVCISEKFYLGVETDAALSGWSRKRIGPTYTSRWFVGHYAMRLMAVRAARDAVRKATMRADEGEREAQMWRANLERAPVRVTAASSPVPDPDTRGLRRDS